MRPEVGGNQSRPGWLPEHTPEAAEEPGGDLVAALIEHVLVVLNSRQCTSEEDLQVCLADRGVTFDLDDLATALTRLVGSGWLMRPRRSAGSSLQRQSTRRAQMDFSWAAAGAAVDDLAASRGPRCY